MTSFSLHKFSESLGWCIRVQKHCFSSFTTSKSVKKMHSINVNTTCILLARFKFNVPSEHCFPASLCRTHLSFLLHKERSLPLFGLFTLLIVWNEQLVTSSQRMWLFRKPTDLACFSCILHALKEVCEKSVWLNTSVRESISLASAASGSSIHLICTGLLSQRLPSQLWGTVIIMNICRRFTWRMRKSEGIVLISEPEWIASPEEKNTNSCVLVRLVIKYHAREFIY